MDNLAIVLGAVGGLMAGCESRVLNLLGIATIYAAGVVAGYATWGPK